MKANKIQNELINECIRLKFGCASKAILKCRNAIEQWKPFLKSPVKKVREEATRTIAKLTWHIGAVKRGAAWSAVISQS